MTNPFENRPNAETLAKQAEKYATEAVYVVMNDAELIKEAIKDAVDSIEALDRDLKVRGSSIEINPEGKGINERLNRNLRYKVIDQLLKDHGVETTDGSDNDMRQAGHDRIDLFYKLFEENDGVPGGAEKDYIDKMVVRRDILNQDQADKLQTDKEGFDIHRQLLREYPQELLQRLIAEEVERGIGEYFTRGKNGKREYSVDIDKMRQYLITIMK